MHLSRNRTKGFALLVWIFSVWSIRVVIGVITVLDFGAEVVCSNSPGLIHRQREMCRASPDAMIAAGDGIRMATNECRYQFRQHRWNCTGIENPSSFGHVVIVGCPDVISRSTWGPDTLKYKLQNLTEVPPTFVVIHHSPTCDTTNMDGLEHCEVRVQRIRLDHLSPRDWDDIGYNFIIGGDGSIFEVRGWGIRGAHHPKFNSRSIGICLVGRFHSSREAAFTYAISSAGVAYSITAACARGNISSCGCDPGPKREPTPSGWKWGGCSVDINYGVRFARRFLDARELEGDARSLMNLHNNKAGRKAVKMNLIVECKCHGVSGSCTMKTCWKTLPTFRQIGDLLMKKYYRARAVASSTSQHNHGPRGVDSPRRFRRQHLVLTKGKLPVKKIPKMSELVFLQMSPNYCERDLAAGSLGTGGRQCNRTSRGTDGCDLMCCGRGYNTHQYTKTYQCRCKFHWCCTVECDTCSERTEEYMCK